MIFLRASKKKKEKKKMTYNFHPEKKKEKTDALLRKPEHSDLPL